MLKQLYKCVVKFLTHKPILEAPRAVLVCQMSLPGRQGGMSYWKLERLLFNNGSRWDARWGSGKGKSTTCGWLCGCVCVCVCVCRVNLLWAKKGGKASMCSQHTHVLLGKGMVHSKTNEQKMKKARDALKFVLWGPSRRTCGHWGSSYTSCMWDSHHFIPTPSTRSSTTL